MGNGEVILRRVLVVLSEDGTPRRVIALEVEGPWGRECFWRAGLRDEEVREAKAIPPEEV